MDLFEKSQQTLELPSVLELLAGEAVSEPAKEACRAVRPSVYRRNHGGQGHDGR